MQSVIDEEFMVCLQYNRVLAAKKIKSGPLGPLVDEPGNMEAKCL